MALLSDLANAALKKTLPAFDSWLQTRLGSAAKVDSIELAGKRVVARGIQLPLGPRMNLEIREAAVAIVARTLKSPRLYVESAVGTLTVSGNGREVSAELALEGGRDRDETWLSGSVVVSGELEGTLEVELHTDRWQLRGRLAEPDAEGDDAGHVTVDARGPLGSQLDPVQELAMDLDRATLAMLTHQTSTWLDVAPPPVPLSDRARVSGSLRWHANELTADVKCAGMAVAEHTLPDPLELSGKLRFFRNATSDVKGHVDVRSARSELHLAPLVWHTAGFDQTRVHGEVAIADALAASMFDSFWRPTPRGTAKIDWTLHGAADWTLGGPTQLPTLELETKDRAGTPVFTFEDVIAEVELNAQRVGASSFEAKAYGTTFTGRGENVVDADATAIASLLDVRFVDANAELARALSSMSDSLHLESAREGVRPLGERWVSPSLKLSGELSIAPDQQMRGDLAVETDGSALLIPLFVGAPVEGVRRLDGTRIRGRMSTADAVNLGLLDGPLAPRPEGTWRVDAKVSGPFDQPSLEAEVEADRVTVDVMGTVDIPLEALHASVLVDPEAIVWKNARAKVCGGNVTSEGVFGRTDAFRGIDTQLTLGLVRIDDFTVPNGRIGDFVRGELSADLHVRRLDATPAGASALSGGGSLRIDDPVYPVIAHAEKQLREVSLPVPPPAGDGPLRCKVSLSDDGIGVTEFEAAVRGISLRAGGKVGFGGNLGGGATARLSGSFLKQSPLFVIPATVAGGITVPIHIGGTLASPALDADVGAALRDKLHTKEISGAVTSAFDGFREAADGLFNTIAGSTSEPRDRARTEPRGNDDAELEALVDRCLDESADTDVLIDRLIEAGVTSEDIVRILEKRRLRF